MKINEDLSENSTKITETVYYSDGFKGWLNSRNPEVLALPLSPGKYYVLIESYTNNSLVRQSVDVHAIATYELPGMATANVVKDKVKIFPNPVQETLHISSGDFAHFRVADLNGGVVNTGTITNSKIAVQDLKPGVYIFTAINNKGEKISEKIIKN